MNTQALLAELRGAGFTLAADGDNITLEPFSRLTTDQINAIRASKPEILAALRAEQNSLGAGQPGNDIDPANDATGRKWDYQRGWWQGEEGPIWVECWTPAGNKIIVAANDRAYAERIRRDNPPPFGGVV